MRLNRYSVQLVRDQSPNGYNLDASSSRAAFDVLRSYFDFGAMTAEIFGILTLDTRNRVIGLHEITKGNLNTSVIHPREIFQRAILNNANSIIMFHNHPSGNIEPSAEDIQITKLLVDAGKLMGIPIIDHLVVSSEGHTSMMEKGLLNKFGGDHDEHLD